MPALNGGEEPGEREETRQIRSDGRGRARHVDREREKRFGGGASFFHLGLKGLHPSHSILPAGDGDESCALLSLSARF